MYRDFGSHKAQISRESAAAPHNRTNASSCTPLALVSLPQASFLALLHLNHADDSHATLADPRCGSVSYIVRFLISGRSIAMFDDPRQYFT